MRLSPPGDSVSREPSLIRRPGRCDLLKLHARQPRRYPFLLESVAAGTPQARYDILFAFPSSQQVLRHTGQADFLRQLDDWFAREGGQASRAADGLPFRGGWFLYLGYELAGQIEPRLGLPSADPALPMAFAVRIPAAVIYDHRADCTWLLAEAGQEALLEALESDLAAARRAPALPAMPEWSLRLREEPGQRYIDSVARVLRYINDGDVFQVNLSRRWELELPDELAPEILYAALRRHNPAPFAGLLRWQDAAVISSSPERLVRVTGDDIATRPIAGTRPRGRDETADRLLCEELRAHPKERAEHVMLVDLERNDLGRVCRPGSIRADELMVLESYAHVHHIVSNVRGRLRAGVTPGEVIRAVFPGGTITGCPKVRCMEIIAELEGEGRGAYTGSMGYLNHNGDMDLNILIRTLQQQGRRLWFRAGAGLVADSVAQRELEETRAKARGLIRALGV